MERIASRPPLFQNRDRSARFCGGVLDPVPTAVAFIPPFAKSAKDGAPEDLWLVESGRVGYPSGCCSPARHLFQLFRVASALHSDFRGGVVDLVEIVGRKFYCEGSDVLVQTR